jgi:hypothetical protein
MYPHLNMGDVVGGVHLPLDGQCDPANIAMALAKGARMRGAQMIEGVLVTGVTTAGGRVTGVDYEAGEAPGHIAADVVVNCGGMWGRDLAAQNGVTLPLHACEHFYLVTEPIAGLGHLPVLRVPDECAYYKTDAGKMMLGAFEPKAKPWGMGGIREDFEFDTLPEDWDHFAADPGNGDAPHAAVPDRGDPHLLQRAGKLHPRRPLLPGRGAGTGRLLDRGGVQLDRHRVLGRGGHGAGALDHRRRAALRPVGGGYPPRAALPEEPPLSEGTGDRDAGPALCRPLPLSADGHRARACAAALHEHLKARGAVFGEVAGWERANWFAQSGAGAGIPLFLGRQNWFDNQRAEHMAVRTGVGLFDMTSSARSGSRGAMPAPS